jgi:hypothetical protein
VCSVEIADSTWAGTLLPWCDLFWYIAGRKPRLAGGGRTTRSAKCPHRDYLAPVRNEAAPAPSLSATWSRARAKALHAAMLHELTSFYEAPPLQNTSRAARNATFGVTQASKLFCTRYVHRQLSTFSILDASGKRRSGEDQRYVVVYSYWKKIHSTILHFFSTCNYGQNWNWAMLTVYIFDNYNSLHKRVISSMNAS